MRFLAFLAAVSLPLSMTSAAQALGLPASVTYTYSGFVAAHTLDTEGVFGPKNEDISNLPFETVETFHLDPAIFSTGGGVFASSQFGGRSNGHPFTATSATTINGVTVKVSDDDYDKIYNILTAFPFNVTAVDGPADGSGVIAATQFTTTDPATPALFTASRIVYAAAPGVEFSGEFLYGQFGFYNLDPSTLVIQASALPSVPLPASAPMFGTAMLVLGAVGYAAKRKHVAAAT